MEYVHDEKKGWETPLDHYPLFAGQGDVEEKQPVTVVYYADKQTVPVEGTVKEVYNSAKEDKFYITVCSDSRKNDMTVEVQKFNTWGSVKPIGRVRYTLGPLMELILH